MAEQFQRQLEAKQRDSWFSSAERGGGGGGGSAANHRAAAHHTQAHQIQREDMQKIALLKPMEQIRKEHKSPHDVWATARPSRHSALRAQLMMYEASPWRLDPNTAAQWV